MGTKDRVYKVIDAAGLDHRIILDKDGAWGYENIFHTIEDRNERRALNDAFIQNLINAKDQTGQWLDVTWSKEGED